MGRYKNVLHDGKSTGEHRAVMERHLGRKLTFDEIVHHKNNDPRDNRIENLELMTREEHSRHHNDKHPRVKPCANCGAMFEPPAKKRAIMKTCSRKCFAELSRMNSKRLMTSGPAPSAKLTEAQVAEIRRRVQSGKESMRAIGRAFGVHHQTVSSIASGKAWAFCLDAK